MFQKEELINKSIEELVEIARSYNIEPETITSQEEAIERIIAESAKESEPVKRTRKRVLKKDKSFYRYLYRSSKEAWKEEEGCGTRSGDTYRASS